MQGMLIILLIIVLVLVVALSNFTYAQDLHTQTLHEITKQIAQPSIAYIPVGKGPSAIGVDTSLDRIYVANGYDNTVSVIDGEKNTKIGNDIPVGKRPVAIAVDTSSDRIYVANEGTISVIDGKNNTKIGKDISYGIFSDINSLAVDSRIQKIYVANKFDNTVSVIGLYNNHTTTKIKDIPVGHSPSAIAVDTDFPSDIYVANEGDGTISVIDGKTYTKIGNDIPVGKGPVAIAVVPSGTTAEAIICNIRVADQENNNKIARDIPVGYAPSTYCPYTIQKIYVANKFDNTVSVIGLYNNHTTTKIKDIPVGRGPSAIAVDSLKMKIYVANTYDSTVSVIDGKTYTKIGNDIPVGYAANAIDFDPDSQAIYVAGGENAVSVIDSEANKVVAKVMFHIEPFNRGHIECDKDKVIVPLAQQFYLWSGSECTAKANRGIEFVSWQENLGGNSSQLIKLSSAPSILDSILDLFHMNPDKPEAKLNITKFGSFTANFQALPPPIPPEYVATLFTVVATALVGSWLTPTLIERRKTRTQRKYFKECISQIGKIDRNAIEDKIIGYYADGKLSDVHHQLLNDKISEYYGSVKGSESAA